MDDLGWPPLDRKHRSENHDNGSRRGSFYNVSEDNRGAIQVHQSTYEFLSARATFLALIPTTVLSLLLLVGNSRQWVTSQAIFDLVTPNRASTQLVVHLVANLLGFLNLAVVLKVINYYTRLRLCRKSMSLNMLRFWNGVLSQQLSAKLPLWLLVALGIFIVITLVPASLWAGAITPVVIVITKPASIQIPSYSNTTTLLFNTTQRFGLPAVQTTKGLFTYNVGERHLGRLLDAASTATTVDGRPRVYQKLDNTGFSYIGRSYGVGMASGLTDDIITQDSLTAGYSYQETGYVSTASCIHNSSTEFFIQPGDPRQDLKIGIARGFLPNSGGREEISRYPGFDTDNIVAIGVATIPEEPRKMLAIAAGEDYQSLNMTQCEWRFEPTLFNVTVDLVNKTITVQPVHAPFVTDIEPAGNLTYLANWQFTLISTDQTSLYSSLVGSSFNTSAGNYVAAQLKTKGRVPSPSEATLGGLTNSITAMMDDILTGYAGAQIMVENVTQPADVTVHVRALALGQQIWIIMVTVMNLVILLLAVVEGIRTRGWRELDPFDYMDPADLILGTAHGLAAAGEIQISSECVGRFRISRTRSALGLRLHHNSADIDRVS